LTSNRKEHKKNRKIFSRSSNNSKRKKGREAQTFFINKKKSRKSQATKVDDDGTYIEIFLAFGSVFFVVVVVFHYFPAHTHT